MKNTTKHTHMCINYYFNTNKQIFECMNIGNVCGYGKQKGKVCQLRTRTYYNRLPIRQEGRKENAYA